MIDWVGRCVCVWHSCVCVWHSCVCVWHSFVCVALMCAWLCHVFPDPFTTHTEGFRGAFLELTKNKAATQQQKDLIAVGFLAACGGTAMVSHGTHMNESWHTHEWVMARMNEPYNTCDCCWLLRGLWWHSLGESCRAFEWVMAHILKSHITHMTAVGFLPENFKLCQKAKSGDLWFC